MLAGIGTTQKGDGAVAIYTKNGAMKIIDQILGRIEWKSKTDYLTWNGVYAITR